MLNRKINAEFIQVTKSSINLELAITPVNLSYYDALAAFRNQVNQKYPPELSTSNNRRPRRMNEVGSMSGGRGGCFQGRGRVCYCRRGGCGRGGIFIVGVDKEADMAEEAGKTWDIDNPDPMSE